MTGERLESVEAGIDLLGIKTPAVNALLSEELRGLSVRQMAKAHPLFDSGLEHEISTEIWIRL